MANSRSKLASQIGRAREAGGWDGLSTLCSMYSENRPKAENKPMAENDGFAKKIRPITGCEWVWPQTEIGLARVSLSYLYRSLSSLSFLTLLSTYYRETSFLNSKARSYILADSKTVKIYWTKLREPSLVWRGWNISWISSWFHHSVFFMRIFAIESLLLSKGHFRPYLICLLRIPPHPR